MELKLAKYLKVLRIELEDLEADLEVMKDLYDRREAQEEITEYVFLENVSLLKSEIAGVESLIKSIDDIPIEQFSNLDEFVDYVDGLFRERTEHSGYPESVYALVKRKLSKVSRYIMSTDS